MRRIGYLAVAAVLALAGPARAAEPARPEFVTEEERLNSEYGKYREQVLGGHLFQTPLLGPTAFPTTHVEFKQGVSKLTVGDFPVQDRLVDVSAFSINERLEFGFQVWRKFSLSVYGTADAFSGSNVRSIVTGGAGFSSRFGVTPLFRLFRGDSSELSAGFNAEFGSATKADLLQLVTQLVDNPSKTVSGIIAQGRINEFVVNSAHRTSQSLFLAYAQAFNPVFGLQLSAIVTHANMHIEYYSAEQRAWHDVHSILWSPEFSAAATMDLSPITVVPVTLMGEYGFRITHVKGEWLRSVQTLALGAYYSGREDLEVGAAGFYTFTFDTTTAGLDETGRPYPSGTPSAWGGVIKLRYTW